jgi:glycosyltransferase involved in cell wall biosynthesis
MKQKILVKGPVLSQSGYGEQARFALRALRSREDIFDIYIHPVSWGKTNWISVDNEERYWIDEQIRKTQLFTAQGGRFDIFLHVTIPNEFENLAPINIGYTAGIETDKVAPEWIAKVNSMNKIIVVSNHAKDVFESTVYEGKNPQTGQSFSLSCNTPIEVVNYPVRKFDKKVLKLDLKYDFNYLAISQWGPRKNFDNLINWFVEENFDKEVGLVLKTSIRNNSLGDRMATEKRLEVILEKYKGRKCSVHLLHGDLSEEEMTGLYQTGKIKCLISTAHGEGYGLPLFEAAYNGLPVIAINWSGQTDFLCVPQKNKDNKPLFLTIDYELKNVQPEAVWKGVINPDSKWAFPKEASFKRRLNEVRDNYPKIKKQAKTLQKYILENFTEEKMYNQFCENVKDKIHAEFLEEIDEMFGELNV